MNLSIKREQIESGTNYSIIIRTPLTPQQGYQLKELGINQLDSCVVDAVNRELISTVTTTIYDAEVSERS